MLRFLVSPVAILGDERVEAVEIVRNELVEEDGRIVARPTGESETIPCGLVLRSVGYQGVALPGVPFDERARRDPERRRPRVDGAERTYVAGWIKRGPSGVIGTNKKDATETVELLLEDARAGRLAGESTASLDELLDAKGVRVRRVRRLAGDRRRRARRRRAARAAAREADRLGAAAGHRPAALASPVVTDTQSTPKRAVGRRDAQGDRQLPRLRRADPGSRRALARPASRPPPRA